MQFEAPCVDSVQAVTLPFLTKNWVWMWGGNCEVGAEALAKQVVTANNAAAVEERGQRAFRKKVSGMGPLKSATCVAAGR